MGSSKNQSGIWQVTWPPQLVTDCLATRIWSSSIIGGYPWPTDGFVGWGESYPLQRCSHPLLIPNWQGGLFISKYSIFLTGQMVYLSLSLYICISRTEACLWPQVSCHLTYKQKLSGRQRKILEKLGKKKKKKKKKKSHTHTHTHTHMSKEHGVDLFMRVSVYRLYRICDI